MRRSRNILLLVALALALGVAAAACGGDDAATAEEPAPAEPAAEEPAPAPAEPAPAEPAPAEPAPAEPAPAEPAPAEASGEPLIIGVAADLTGPMAPFNGPALAAAQAQAAKINEAGGVLGRQIQFEVVDSTVDGAKTKQAAIDVLDKGAEVLLVTCDVDFAAPAVQEAIGRGVLAVAPCIGTDQMGPKRFGPDAGKLAFTVGNIAQDEGAAMAEFAWDQGWQTAAIAKDNVIVYFQDVVDSFAKRFEELGGTVAATEQWVNGDETIGNVAGALADQDVDVYVTSTAFGDLPGLVEGIRSLGKDTPILCSWACDGTYWNPAGLSNFYLVAYASISGDDPNPDVNALKDELAAQDPLLVGTGGFVTGAATIDTIVAAIEAAGSTDGAALAAALESGAPIDTISGKVQFSPEYHGVTGREYRVMQIQDGALSFVEARAATSPADIAGAGK